MPELTHNLRRILEIVTGQPCPEGEETRGGRAIERFTNKVITEGTWRNWFNNPKAKNAVKLGDFAEFIGLKRAHLVGDIDIPDKWWREFAEKHQAGGRLKNSLLAAA